MKRFLRNNALLALQPFITKAIAYVVIPLYTLKLSPIEFGNVEYILALGVFFKTFISMSTTSSFWKYINEKEKWASGQVIFSVIIIPVSLGTLGLTCLLIGCILFPHFISPYLIIFCLSEIISILYMVVNLVIRNNFNATRFLFITFLYVLSFISSSYLFVGKLGLKEYGVFYSYLLSSVIVGFGSASLLKNHLQYSINIPLIKDIIRYSFPLMLTNLVAIVISLNDRILIKLIRNPEELGLYMYGVKFSAIIKSIFIDVFFIVWNPIRWRIYHLRDGEEIFSSLSRLLFVLFIVGGFAASSISYFLGQVLSENPVFSKGLVVVPIITFAHVLFGMYYYSVMGLLFKNQTRKILLVSIAVLGCSLVLNVLLIYVMGFYGSAIAMFISFLGMFLLGNYLSQKVYRIDSFRKRNLFVVVVYVTVNIWAWAAEITLPLNVLNLAFICVTIAINTRDFQLIFRHRNRFKQAIHDVS
jgi:O-antigen/teichoic acid export membrane protein